MPFIQPLEVVGPAESGPVSDLPGAAMPVIDELRGLFAHFPDGLGAFDQMYQRMVGQGRLEQSLRFVILGAAARWRSDPFIAGTMFRLAMDDGMEAQAVGGLIDECEGAEPTSAEALLLVFCRKATENAFKMVEKDLEPLRAVGWTTGQIVEAVTMVSLSGYMTVMAASGGLLHSPGLEPEPWR